MEKIFPASPNWYCSHVIDGNSDGVVCFGAKNSLYLWDVSSPASPKFISHFIAHEERVVGVSLCQTTNHKGDSVKPSRKCCSAGEDGKVKIWDLQTNALLMEHSHQKSKLTTVHWSPVDADLVASGDDRGGVVVFNVSTRDVWTWQPDPSHTHVFCLAFSPHSRYLCAVGFKTGAVMILDLSKKTQPIVARLRGHDDEIHSIVWSPPCSVKSSDALAEQPTTDTTHIIATSSRDKMIRLWNSLTGHCLSVMHIPGQAGHHRRDRDDPAGFKVRVWVALAWPRHLQDQIISSGSNGELIQWNIRDIAKPKYQIISPGSLHRGHNRIVFNIVTTGPDSNTLVSISMDRQIVIWDLSASCATQTIPSLGGYVYAIVQSPLHPGKFAVGVGDNLIRICNFDNKLNDYDVQTFWQGIRSKVTALCWHPVKEGLLAYGTEDGRVGIYDVLASRSPVISCTYHKKTVYVVTWGPSILSSNQVAADGSSLLNADFQLYSVGDGVILQHRSLTMDQPARDISAVIKETNNIAHKMPSRSEMSWSFDFKHVAIGNEDGSIDVLRGPHLLLLCTIRVHKKIINCLRWHPEHTSESTAYTDGRYWLASGSNEAVVHVYDLKQILCHKTSAEPTIITESFRQLEGHTNRITGLCWSLNKCGMLASVSYDWTAQVWDVVRSQPIANFRGHHGRLLCVAWSSLDDDVIYTGGDDYTLQAWRISQQKDVRPPLGSERKTYAKSKSKAKESAVHRQVEGAATRIQPPNDVVSEPVASLEPRETAELMNLLEQKRLQLLEAKNSNDFVKASDATSPQRLQNKDKDDEGEGEDDGPLSPNIQPDSSASTVQQLIDNAAKKGRKKKRVAKSLFPKSSAADNRGKAPTQLDCVHLAKLKYSGCVPTSLPDGLSHLGHFLDRRNTLALYQQEEAYHIEHENIDQFVMLNMFRGSTMDALKHAADIGQLNDHMMALAPSVSMEFWEELCDKYVGQLLADGQHHKAASYLLTNNKVYDAIRLLKDHGFYKDAVCLARVRLSPLDSLLNELYLSWGQHLAKDGNFELAAKCFLASGEVIEAAGCLAKRADLPAVKIAAQVTLPANQIELSQVYAHKYVRESLLNSDWSSAAELIQESTEYDFLAVLASVYEVIFFELSLLGAFEDVSVVEPPAWISKQHEYVPVLTLESKDPLSCWWPAALVGGKPMIDFLIQCWRETWKINLDVEHVSQLYIQLLKLRQAKQCQTDLKQILLEVSLDVALGTLKLVLGDEGLACGWFVSAIVLCINLDKVHLQVVRLLVPEGLDCLKKKHHELNAQVDVKAFEQVTEEVSSAKEQTKLQENEIETIKDMSEQVKSEGTYANILRAFHALTVLRFLFSQLSSSPLVGNAKPIGATTPTKNTSTSPCVHLANSTKLAEVVADNSLSFFDHDFSPILASLKQALLSDVLVRKCALAEALFYIQKALSDLTSLKRIDRRLPDQAMAGEPFVVNNGVNCDRTIGSVNGNGLDGHGPDSSIPESVAVVEVGTAKVYTGASVALNGASQDLSTGSPSYGLATDLVSQPIPKLASPEATGLTTGSFRATSESTTTVPAHVSDAKSTQHLFSIMNTKRIIIEHLSEYVSTISSTVSSGHQPSVDSTFKKRSAKDIVDITDCSDIPKIWYSLPEDVKYTQSYVTVPLLDVELSRLQTELGSSTDLKLFPHPLECAFLLMEFANRLSQSAEHQALPGDDFSQGNNLLPDERGDKDTQTLGNCILANSCAETSGISIDEFAQAGARTVSDDDCRSACQRYRAFAESVRQWGLHHAYSSDWCVCFASRSL